jgi:UDP-N-acetylmuramyl pentapeptide phosphotransferase/UDP-N-acetylglucosamine-1-phosphate transferase
VSFGVALVTAWVFTHALVGCLKQAGCVVANYRGLEVPRPAGLGVVAGVCAGALAGAVSASLSGVRMEGVTLLSPIALCLGMAAAGILDDLAGSAEHRGFSGHIGALMRGRLTTGAVKLLTAVLVCAAVALAGRPGGGVAAAARVAIDTLALAASANAINLLDTRPGRAVKGALALLTGVVAAGGGVWAAALAAGAALGYVGFDLREQGMLGDAGSNPLGALVGLAALQLEAVWFWLFLTVVIGLNLASEFASIGKLIETCPPLAAIDRLGRKLPDEGQQ